MVNKTWDRCQEFVNEWVWIHLIFGSHFIGCHTPFIILLIHIIITLIYLLWIHLHRTFLYILILLSCLCPWISCSYFHKTLLTPFHNNPGSILRILWLYKINIVSSQVNLEKNYWVLNFEMIFGWEPCRVYALEYPVHTFAKHYLREHTTLLY